MNFLQIRQICFILFFEIYFSIAASSNANKNIARPKLPIILGWNNFFDTGNVIRTIAPKEQTDECPSKCIYSENRNDSSHAAAIIFHGNLVDFKPPIPANRHPKQLYVFFSMEAPYSAIGSEFPVPDFFNFSMTYRAENSLNLHAPYGSFQPANISNKADFDDMWDAKEILKKVRRKRKSILFIASNCSPLSGRQFYVEKLSKFINITKYGKCVNLECDQQCYDREIGFRYVRASTTSTNYWKCWVKNCKVRAKVVENRNDVPFGKISKKNAHNHLPEPQRQIAERKRKNAKNTIRTNPRKKQGDIVTEARDGASLEVIEQMGDDQALKMMIFREKKKLFGNVNCRNPLAIELTDELIMMNDESILLYDSREVRANQADVVMVFAHKKLIEILKTKKKWSVNGTFRVAPAPWKQCFVVGAFVNSSQIIVCAHALLPGKHVKYYMEALNAIKTATQPSNPTKVVSDFEQSILKATKTVFPMTASIGCMFHFSQSIYRKWRSLGLEALMVDEEIGENVRHTFRRVLALPLIPIEQVRRAFSLIIDESPPNLSHFLMYFAEVYIGFTQIELQIGANAFLPGTTISNRRSTISQISTEDRQSTIPTNRNNQSDHNYPGDIFFGRPSPIPSTPTMTTTTVSEEIIAVRRWEMEIVRRPLYEIRFWNVHHEALHALSRTNNSMESTHRQFQKGLNHHPALSDFLLALQDDIRKQLTKEQAGLLFPPIRNRHNVIHEKNVMYVLNKAEYDEDEDLLELITLLGIQMQGYVAGMRAMDNQQEDIDRTEDTINLDDEASIFDWNEELEQIEHEIDHSSIPSTSSQRF